MNDITGKELHFGDLVFTNAGCNSRMSFGIVRRTDYNLHLYRLDVYGVSTAQADMKLANKHGKCPWYAHGGSTFLKIPVDLLPLQSLSYYKEIMKIINLNVATTNNT